MENPPLIHPGITWVQIDGQRAPCRDYLCFFASTPENPNQDIHLWPDIIPATRVSPSA
jgi:hypothetical protein